MKSAPVIAFEYRPSRWLAMTVVVLTVLALIALAVCGMPLWMKLPIAVCALTYAAICLTRFWRVSPIEVTWYSAGHWGISGMHDDETVAELDHAIVQAGWIVLTLRRTNGERLRLPLSPDVCDRDTRRRLQVRLARSSENPARVV